MDLLAAPAIVHQSRAAWRMGMEHAARLICPRCAVGDPHHTNALHSIGGSEGRHPVYDLHVAEGRRARGVLGGADLGSIGEGRPLK
ncbi:MAG TPA: hypothetical protein DCP69_02410 [Candidatus Omnitrophica bacterium]|nr:hypothetical protein [Candidatus Omnitrophota bacterium]